jgi:hypothetical protein
MKPKRPSPPATHHVVVRMPGGGPSPADPWVDRTYELIEGFEAELRALPGAAGDAGAPFIIAASDYRWARFGPEAAWERLDIGELFLLFASFAGMPGWRGGCLSTLAAFYAYLDKIGAVASDDAARITAELLARLRDIDPEVLERGLEAARRLNRAERRAQVRAGRRRASS